MHMRTPASVPAAAVILALLSCFAASTRRSISVNAENPRTVGSTESCDSVNETFRAEIRLEFRNTFIEELEGDEDLESAAKPREVTFQQPNVASDAAPAVHKNLTPRALQILKKFWAVASLDPLQPSADLLAFSEDAGKLLGISGAATRDEVFRKFASGEHLLPGSRPYAMAYGGHQFGYWAGQLGDGRATNLGEIVGPDGRYLLLPGFPSIPSNDALPVPYRPLAFAGRGRPN